MSTTSTDLELIRQDFPNIKLSPIKIHTPEPVEAPCVASRIAIQQRRRDADADADDDDKDKINYDNKEEEAEEELLELELDLCRTPTAERHRIPKILTCPPAPRKPERRVPSCKRKLTELQFFEVKKREDVDEFFRSMSFQTASSSAANKRSCCCPCK
ncbi:hypothetical protein PanWU01x14_229430 [Parasponia andersonii]|uniref:Uncharacterized protein n=1 Tax=Parasponia andersonii TaxID=3476 RepID=A0A2P5BL63_PARAD|nr:hypothetical protein PanWU01x14_229430 [Parasponia andersonii]